MREGAEIETGLLQLVLKRVLCNNHAHTKLLIRSLLCREHFKSQASLRPVSICYLGARYLSSNFINSHVIEHMPFVTAVQYLHAIESMTTLVWTDFGKQNYAQSIMYLRFGFIHMSWLLHLHKFLYLHVPLPQ